MFQSYWDPCTQPCDQTCWLAKACNRFSPSGVSTLLLNSVTMLVCMPLRIVSQHSVQSAVFK